MDKTAALLIGFGGPQNMEEVRPFLDSVLEGVKIPSQRYQEVLHHYEVIGGISYFNTITYRQKEALEKWLSSLGHVLPIGVGFRHSQPGFREAFEILKKAGVKKVVGFVLASFRSFSSFEKYRAKISEAQRAVGAEDIQIAYTDPFAGNPFFWEAQAGQVRETIKAFTEEEKHTTYFLFSAHSIPIAVPGQAVYSAQFQEAAAGIAKLLKLEKNWSIAYQSRSGNPKDPWLEPDFKEVIRNLDKEKFNGVLLIPVGFLCDNVEVVYDLDIEAKQACEAGGFKYFRASTVADHPKFIEMMGRQILEKV